MLKRKLLVIALGGVLIVSLASCGGSNSPASISSTQVSTTSTVYIPVYSSTSTPLSTKSTTATAVNNDVNVSAVPSVQSTNPGSSFDVIVRAKTNKPARGLQFVLNWDPTKVQCNSVEQGNYFTDFAAKNDASVFTSPTDVPKVDNNNGRFPVDDNPSPNINTEIAIVLIGANGLGVTGSGDLFTLHFSAKNDATGTINFELYDVKFGDVNAKDLNTSVTNGSVTLQR